MTRHMSPPRLILLTLAIAVLGLGGCTTAVMQSTTIDNRNQRSLRGLVYALPKAQVELKASRKMITAKEVADAKAAAEKAAAASKEAKTAKDAAQASVDVITALHKATLEPGKTELHKQLTILEAQLGLATRTLKEREAKQKEAQDTVDRLEPLTGMWLETATLTVMPPVPDPADGARYVANWSGSMTRDDEFKLTVAGGLLNSADAVSVDQSAAILVSLAQGVAGWRFESNRLARSTSRLQKQTSKSDLRQCKSYEIVRRFDPTSAAEVASLAKDLESIGSADIALDIAPKPAGPDHSKVGARNGNNEATAVPGVHYRPLVAASLTLGSRTQGAANSSCTGADDDARKSETLVAVVPDSRTLALLPVEAGMFTKTTHKLVFKDGTPTEVSISSPSQLAAIAGLPIAIAKAMLSVPGELIKLRVNYDSDAAKSLTDQVTQLTKQIELLKAQRLLEAELKVDATASTAP